jgi:hypothetical protein
MHPDLSQIQKEKDNALLIACETGNLKEFKRLVKLQANPKTCGHQALIWALKQNHESIVNELSKFYKKEELRNIVLKRFSDTPPPLFIKILQNINKKEIRDRLSKSLTKSKELEI